MKKHDALRLLGGTPTSVAAAIGISPSAVSQWPDELPARVADRVLAVLARRHLPPELIGTEGAPPIPDTPPADAPVSQAGELDAA